ncbi:hypothetical protein L1887_05649 [Cichorium endivia]|nr:hypothetical protein L1887_05649 [Cichorium endivia]
MPTAPTPFFVGQSRKACAVVFLLSLFLENPPWKEEPVLAPLLITQLQATKFCGCVQFLGGLGFSTFHALFAAVGSLYFLVVSDLFDEHTKEELLINRSSASLDTFLSMSIGYFLSDLAMIIWTYPTLGGFEYILHHGLSMLALGQALLSGQVQFYILIVLFTEVTTPFVNLRWYLDVAGKKNSTLYMLNGVAMFAGWLVARVILFVFFFYHLFTHFDQLKQVYPMGYYSVLTIPPALAVMNLVWFRKIAKGLIKTLTNSKGHSHSN